MPQNVFQPQRDVERRAVGRTTINRDVSMFFLGQDRVHPCCSVTLPISAPAFG
jgi:hypothetical protein